MKSLEGKAVLIRTVTSYFTGRVLDMDDQWIHLGDAAWIADTGRFSNALRTGELEEVEPYPSDCLVSRQAVVDLCEWSHQLPRLVR
jgi:hypothetical protein